MNPKPIVPDVILDVYFEEKIVHSVHLDSALFSQSRVEAESSLASPVDPERPAAGLDQRDLSRAVVLDDRVDPVSVSQPETSIVIGRLLEINGCARCQPLGQAKRHGDHRKYPRRAPKAAATLG